MPRETFKVGGLFTEEDKDEIETYLKQIDGVKRVEASINDKTVDVDFDSAVVDSGWLKETLQSLGHDTSVLS